MAAQEEFKEIMESYFGPEVMGLLDELGTTIQECNKVIPYVKHAFEAYKYIRGKRMLRFFISAIPSSMSEIDKEKFKGYIESKTGKEMLLEYSDSVLQTSSEIAIAALGLLYGDTGKKYDNEFKRIACFSLKGATDDLIEAFMILSSIEKNEKSPYPIVTLSQNVFEASPNLKSVLRTPEDVFAYVHELIRRGLFLPDPTPNRGAIAGTWFICFGCTNISDKLRDLIFQAKTVLKQHRI